MHLSNLQRDPLFASELADLEATLRTQMMQRTSIMDRINDTAETAMKVCNGAVEGIVNIPVLQADQKEVPIHLRLKSAWDMLDRAGYKPMDKRVEVKADLAEMITAAYEANKLRRTGVEDPVSTNPTSPQNDDVVDIEGELISGASQGDNIINGHQQLNLFSHKDSSETGGPVTTHLVENIDDHISPSSVDDTQKVEDDPCLGYQPPTHQSESIEERC